MADHSSIGDVARAVGVSVEALRYYEAEGLLAPERDGGGRRRYSEVDVDQARVITALREVGFGIREIAQSGRVAIGRGARSITDRSLRAVPGTQAG